MVVINDELARLLLTIVRNSEESDDLRGAAAIALGPVLEQTFMDDFDDPDELTITEETYDHIRQSLHTAFLATANPKGVRRRVLEASVRAPEDWHNAAIRTAYASGDPEWVLTAVFAMQYVRGFDAQILESLQSSDPLVRFHAIEAAGTWEVKAAFPVLERLVKDSRTPKNMRIAAIEAVASIHPENAAENLWELTTNKDREIAEAASEAIQMAEATSGLDDDEDEDDEEGTGWVN
jgi:HEAT repeat protein